METCGESWETLAEYGEGRATGPARARLDAHLASGCGECQARLDWLARAAAALAAPALAPAPAALQRRARALFRERLRQPATRPWPLIARLVFSGWAAPAFARGEGGPSLHQVYAVAGREIDLWQEREPGGVSYLIGQVLTARPAALPLTAATLTAVGPEAAPLAATLEEDEFHLAGVPAGMYTLTLVLGEEMILVPGVTVAADTGATP